MFCCDIQVPRFVRKIPSVGWWSAASARRRTSTSTANAGSGKARTPDLDFGAGWRRRPSPTFATIVPVMETVGGREARSTSAYRRARISEVRDHQPEDISGHVGGTVADGRLGPVVGQRLADGLEGRSHLGRAGRRGTGRRRYGDQ